jgi:saccharopine dehydrogenase-like NADP-dependent oxidoreductase
MKNVTVVIGSGSIGQAIARRAGAGEHVLLADRQEIAQFSDVIERGLAL